MHVENPQKLSPSPYSKILNERGRLQHSEKFGIKKTGIFAGILGSLALACGTLGIVVVIGLYE